MVEWRLNNNNNNYINGTRYSHLLNEEASFLASN